MPHSSGGGSGSHGGGGSSFHSGSSGGGGSFGGGGGFFGGDDYGNGYTNGSPPKLSRGYFAGAKRYRYRWRGQDHYFYSMYNTGSDFRPLRGLLVVPLILVCLAVMFWPFLKSLKKYDRNILVDDKLNVLDDSSRLREAMEAFSEKTKITPAVVTLYNEEWQRFGVPSLEEYAYSQYLMRFQDEKHWLIMYSEPKEKTGNWEWFWEGMQGNDTDPVLTPYVTEAFNVTMHSGLVNESSPVPDIMADAFEAVTAKAQPKFLRPKIGMERILIGCMVLCVIIGWGISFMGLHRFKYRNAEYDPEDFGGGEDDQYRKIPASLSSPAPAKPLQPGLYATSGMHTTSGEKQFGQRQTEMATLESPQPAKPVFCRNCGMKNKAGTVICPSCGSRLG